MRSWIFVKILLSGLLLLVTGCATLEVTPKQVLTPVTDKQGVSLGVHAFGDRLIESLKDPESSIIKTASGKLFDKVVLLPNEAKYLQPKAIQSAYSVDYILSAGIADISVSGDLNPIWFPSLLLFVFKVYTPIVTFQPGVAIDTTLTDARTGAVLMQKQHMEASSDHYAPSNPTPKIKKLISLTINNALVSIMRDSQQSIAAARQGKK
jgi:hypothetical protein